MICFWGAGPANVNFSHFPMKSCCQQPENETIQQKCSVQSLKLEEHGPVFTKVDFFPCLLNRNVGSSLTFRQHLPSGANHVPSTVVLYICWSQLSQHQDIVLCYCWVRQEFFYINNCNVQLFFWRSAVFQFWRVSPTLNSRHLNISAMPIINSVPWFGRQKRGLVGFPCDTCCTFLLSLSHH